MSFELKHSSLRAFLVPNHTNVNVKIRGEEEIIEDWRYRGIDDDQKFILVTNGDRSRWLPIGSIAYIEQVENSSR